MKPSRREHRQHGFALLMTLVLSTVAAAALAGIASRSLVGAIEARDETRRVQQQWAVRSLRASLLPRVERSLLMAEGRTLVDQARDRPKDEEFAPHANLRLTCSLADRDYEIVLTDEQARLNVNHALSYAERSDVEASVRRLARKPDGGKLNVGDVDVRPAQRRPSFGGVEDADATDRVTAYAQVFPDSDPAALFPVVRRRGDVRGVAASVTCWGSGPINFRRASDDVIRAACRDALPPGVLKSLLEARREQPSLTLADALKRVPDLTTRDQEKVEQHLTDQTSAFGLWIAVRELRRDRYYFSVTAPTKLASVGSPNAPEIDSNEPPQRGHMPGQQSIDHNPSPSTPVHARIAASANPVGPASSRLPRRYDFAW